MASIPHHGLTETRKHLISGEVTGAILGAAIEVHCALGPGLLESAYEECLCRELSVRNINFNVSRLHRGGIVRRVCDSAFRGGVLDRRSRCARLLNG